MFVMLYNITKQLATHIFWLQKFQKLLSPFKINYQLQLNTKATGLAS